MQQALVPRLPSHPLPLLRPVTPRLPADAVQATRPTIVGNKQAEREMKIVAQASLPVDDARSATNNCLIALTVGVLH